MSCPATLRWAAVFYLALALPALTQYSHAAGPRDNPLLNPPLPDLPDLYTEDEQQPEKTSEANGPDQTEPQPARIQPGIRAHKKGESQATREMRADLQRQISQYYNLTGQTDNALIHLLAAKNRGWLALQDSRVALDAARLYHRLNLPLEAERLYTSLPDWQIPKNEKQKFLLERIQSHYNRGVYRSAARLLEQLGTPADLKIASRVESLRIRILIAQGRYGTINEIFEQQMGRPRNNLYTRYNLGVSLVASGQTGEGIGLLDELGSIDAIDPEPMALRDQANLSLGWAFLQADQGSTARPFFRRVRLSGPFSNSALLALGWALIAPDGEPQQKVITRLQNCIEDPAQLLQATTAVMRRPPREGCGKPKVFRYKRDLEFEPAEEEANKRLQAALTPWNRLIKRPAHDPAVQEALLARGYLFEQLNANNAAAGAYRLAIQRLEEERRHMKAIQQRLQQAPLEIFQQNTDQHHTYLAELISSPQIAETRQSLLALQNYGKRLQKIHGQLQQLPPAAVSAGKIHDAEFRLQQLQLRHDTLKAGFEDVIKRLINRQFEARDKQLGIYLKRARLALVELHS